jgi:hypothetical protein
MLYLAHTGQAKQQLSTTTNSQDDRGASHEKRGSATGKDRQRGQSLYRDIYEKGYAGGTTRKIQRRNT